MGTLITGGTGTLGQALVKELLASDESRICILSRDEHKQFEMREALPDPDKRLRWFLGDIREAERLRRAFEGIDTVIHTAAMKQVEASEFNPYEAVKTNVLGSQNVIEAAIDCGVGRVIAVSTDKAANPTTLYGATKLCAERLFMNAGAYAGRHGPTFNVVRFGNIAMSRGSVIPKWKALIASGVRVVPVTDPDCTRFWITAEDAARFILNGLHDGEIAIPEMPSFCVRDLALAMDVAMFVTGLGKGEKLHEAGSEYARRMTVEELRGHIT